MNPTAESSLLGGLPPGSHILYLDDQETLVRLAKRALEGLGYRYSGFVDAREAMGAIQANPGDFDLILTDLNLGPISGLDIAREVHSLRPNLPVALISAYLTAEIHDLAREAGVRRVLAKAATFDDLIRDLSSEEAPVDAAGTLIDHTPVAGRQLSVLVVDDDAAVRRFLCEVLQMDGHVTKEAADGGDALRQLAENPADLVITDLCMPEKEGIEMIRELRESGARTKIIAISGVLGQPALAAAKMLGADAVLAKPVGADALLNAVAEVAAA